MAYTALYRLYRPSDFEDLVGQEHIKKTVKNALQRQKFAHAYLFTGPRGTGKTSTAKLIGKAVNCLSPTENGEPCNECDNCLAVKEGTMNDIVEIDAASNNGVDEIRNIREQVHFSPSQGKYKVYIIDEVHMLSMGAFNALLKTLEEPPAHIIFILATTEPHKIPLTIISRCQRFDFRRISPSAIVERMKYIVKDQNLQVDDEALQLIASIAQGGMRDALSLLDQSISYAADQVNAEDVTTIIGKTSIRFVGNVVELIEKGDISAVIEQVDEIIEQGKEPEYFIEDLIGYYRDVLLFKTTNNPTHLNTAVVDDQFKSIVYHLEQSTVQSMIAELLDCQTTLKWSKQAKTSIEVTLVRLIDLKGNESDNNKQQEANNPITEMLIEQVSSLREEFRRMKNTTQTNQIKELPDTAKIIKEKILPSASKPYVEFLKGKYNRVLSYLGTKNEGLFRMLSKTQPVLCSRTHVVIYFNERHAMETAYDEDNIHFIEKAIDEVIGQPLKVVFTESQEWIKITEDYKKMIQQQKERKQA
ncbi:DNA polymerase III subunit gamma/tau [Virgibacillus halodenitrificans]|uniref:DNA polymerase III subunit gamma/tau n=1 Tax=Virgibacillus halodenitrificans TaxID=1482 RepID=UPI000EF4ED6A|nr:DNA polymerase III subunit gamma/tau [Virgibacillus halodenitrificans]